MKLLEQCFNGAPKTGISDIQEDRKQITWCLSFYRSMSFLKCSYNISAKDKGKRVDRAVTTRTSRGLRPQLRGAAIDFVVMWLEAPARPSFS